MNNVIFVSKLCFKKKTKRWIFAFFFVYLGIISVVFFVRYYLSDNKQKKRENEF